METDAEADAPIRVADLTVVRDAWPIRRGVSFAVRAHRVCGLVGPPGAGKTTVLRALSGLVIPDEGTAHVLGRPYEGPWDRRRDVTIALDGDDSRALGHQLA